MSVAISGTEARHSRPRDGKAGEKTRPRARRRRSRISLRSSGLPPSLIRA